MVGILVSFWDGLCSGAMLVSGGVPPRLLNIMDFYGCLTKAFHLMIKQSDRMTSAYAVGHSSRQ